MMGLQLRMAQECSCCRELIDEEEASDNYAVILLYGSAKYGVCVGCFRSIPGPWGRNYKARWNRAFRRKAGTFDAKVSYPEGKIASGEGEGDGGPEVQPRVD